MTRAESIAHAIFALMTEPPMSSVPAADVYNDLIYALDLGVSWGLVVELGDEPPPLQDNISTYERTVEVNISAIRKGRAPYTLADPMISEVHARLLADRLLGGLAMNITDGPTQRRRDSLEKLVGVVTKTYRVVYRTGADSLE